MGGCELEGSKEIVNLDGLLQGTKVTSQHFVTVMTVLISARCLTNRYLRDESVICECEI